MADHTITWTNVDLSSQLFGVIQLSASSQEVFMNLIHNRCSEMTILNLQPHLPGANELSFSSESISVSMWSRCNAITWLTVNQMSSKKLQ